MSRAPEPGHLDPCVAQQRLAQRFGALGPNADFETVLASITRTAHQAGLVHRHDHAGVHEPQGADLRREPRQSCFRQRPLQRHQGAVGEPLDVAGAREMSAEMGLVRLLAGGIHHENEMIALNSIP